MKTRTIILAAAGIASLTMGCKGSPAAPFNTLQDSQITVFRLQNYQEPAAAAPAPAQPTPQPGAIPGLPGLPIPPEFQPQVQQAQNMICQMMPPGTPGCAPTGQPATQPVQAPANAPMFEEFRIIGQAQVMDPSLREEIIDIFGYDKSFHSKMSPCMFPEFGMSFGGGGPQPPANLLVSYSCNQVQARNFNWPHPSNGMKEKTVENLNEVIQKLFGGG